jgi:hypothetical protein
MLTDSTVEITTYGDLACGDLFIFELSGRQRIGMKVASKGHPSDAPNSDVLELRDDGPPTLFPANLLKGRRIVAKMKNLAFSVRPNARELIFNHDDDRVRRQQEGCAFLIGNDVYLVAEVKDEGVSFVNMKTGDGTPTIPSRDDAIVVLRWQIIQIIGDKETPWIEYTVPSRG